MRDSDPDDSDDNRGGLAKKMASRGRPKEGHGDDKQIDSSKMNAANKLRSTSTSNNKPGGMPQSEEM